MSSEENTQPIYGTLQQGPLRRIWSLGALGEGSGWDLRVRPQAAAATGNLEIYKDYGIWSEMGPYGWIWLDTAAKMIVRTSFWEWSSYSRQNDRSGNSEIWEFGDLGTWKSRSLESDLRIWVKNIFRNLAKKYKDFLKTKKMRNVRSINLVVVSRRDLYYVPENASFCFGQK